MGMGHSSMVLFSAKGVSAVARAAVEVLNVVTAVTWDRRLSREDGEQVYSGHVGIDLCRDLGSRMTTS